LLIARLRASALRLSAAGSSRRLALRHLTIM